MSTSIRVTLPAWEDATPEAMRAKTEEIDRALVHDGNSTMESDEWRVHPEEDALYAIYSLRSKSACRTTADAIRAVAPAAQILMCTVTEEEL